MKRRGLLGIVAASAIVLGACSSSSDPGSPASVPVTEGVQTSEVPTDSAAPTDMADGALYALTTTEDGSTTRFDSCAGPIRILLNTGDLQEVISSYTDVDAATQIGELLTQNAQELSEATGMDIQYAGTTDIAPSDELADTQVIVLNFGSVGFPGREDSLYEQKAIYGASKEGWQQIVSYQHFESSLGFYIHFEEAAKLADGRRDVGIDESGKRWLKTILGEALGLRQLTDMDMEAAGVSVEERGAQIMYTDSYKENDGVYNLTWGEGDLAGLAAVGVDSGCF